MKVLDYNGNLLPNSTVTVYADATGYPPITSGTTDSNGQASLTVDANTSVVVQAEYDGTASQAWYGSVPDNGGTLILPFDPTVAPNFIPTSPPSTGATGKYLLIGSVAVGAVVLGYILWRKFL